VVQNLLEDNDRTADEIHERFEQAKAYTVNIMASPGSGKTSVILRAIGALEGQARVGVIEGDIASAIDTEKVLQGGAHDAVQINTGGNCHLEAGMVKKALPSLNLDELDFLFIENVGNLICPNHWCLGEHLKLCLVSTAEGHDKPLKYPEIFAASDVILLNKMDLMAWVDFDAGRFYEALRSLSPNTPVFEISCRTGEGVSKWVRWLKHNESKRLAHRVALF